MVHGYRCTPFTADTEACAWFIYPTTWGVCAQIYTHKQLCVEQLLLFLLFSFLKQYFSKAFHVLWFFTSQMPSVCFLCFSTSTCRMRLLGREGGKALLSFIPSPPCGVTSETASLTASAYARALGGNHSLRVIVLWHNVSLIHSGCRFSFRQIICLSCRRFMESMQYGWVRQPRVVQCKVFRLCAIFSALVLSHSNHYGECDDPICI